MPLLALSDSLTDARTRWLSGDVQAWNRYSGDVQAWNRYVECCLQLEAELRKVQRAHASDGTAQPRPKDQAPAPRS